MEKVSLFLSASLNTSKGHITMPEDKKSKYRGFTPAQAEAHKRYMENFVEVKVRMTADNRSKIKAHAADHGESVNAFINRAINETMERDQNK